MTKAFERMASAVYSTKRNAAGVTQTTRAVVNLAVVLGTPPMPVSTDIIDRYRIQSPRQHFVIFFEGSPDILAGDFIVYGSKNFPVRGLGPWPTDLAFLEVVVEDVA